MTKAFPTSLVGRRLRHCLSPRQGHDTRPSLRVRLPSPSSLSGRAPLHSYSTESSNWAPKQSRVLRPGLVVSLFLGSAVYYLTTSSSSADSETLNDTTFVPYTIAARTALSPSSFVLTVTPNHPNPDPPYLLPGSNRWRHPLWSVEFKQPEVQISRHYTPLPPPFPSDSPGATSAAAVGDVDEAAGALRFYIRAVGDGEMSRYLSRLRPGHTVHLRGPHVGFDLVRRLGAGKSIVFLAGGTGVVPGMQAARVALDGYEDTRVSLLWAVRQRGEIQSSARQERAWWDFSRAKEPIELDPALEGPSPVAGQLVDMKRQYGDRFRVQVVVDEDKGVFRQSHIEKALSTLPGTASFPSNPGTGCSLHDQRMHEDASEFESSSPNCRCTPVDGTLPGKNLFIVSGPDGFVTHYAGPKLWRGGSHTQGPVGGIVSQVQSNTPELARDWLVLKL